LGLGKSEKTAWVKVGNFVAAKASVEAISVKLGSKYQRIPISRDEGEKFFSMVLNSVPPLADVQFKILEAYLRLFTDKFYPVSFGS